MTLDYSEYDNYASLKAEGTTQEMADLLQMICDRRLNKSRTEENADGEG